MSTLNLDTSSRGYLTRVIDGETILVDIDGNPLASGVPPLRVCRDMFTGDAYVQLCEKIPGGTIPDDVAKAAKITALNPIHFVNGDGSVNGYFVPAPTFKAAATESQAPNPSAALYPAQ